MTRTTRFRIKLALAIGLVATAALGTERVILNPESNGDLKIKANVGGTATDAITVTGSTGAVTVGATNSTATQTINGTPLTLTVGTNTTSDGVFNIIGGTSGRSQMKFQQNGASPTTAASIGASSGASGHIVGGDAAGDLAIVSNSHVTYFSGDNGNTVHGSMTAAGVWTMPTQPAVSAYRITSDQSCVSGTSDATCTVVFNSETFDQAANYDPTTGLFTCPVAGKYLVAVALQWTYTTNPATSPAVSLQLEKNSTLIPGDFASLGEEAVSPTGRRFGSATWLVSCAATDVLRVRVSSNVGNGGSNRVLNLNSDRTSLSIAKLF